MISRVESSHHTTMFRRILFLGSFITVGILREIKSSEGEESRDHIIITNCGDRINMAEEMAVTHTKVKLQMNFTMVT